jgi:hypothetical protein
MVVCYVPILAARVSWTWLARIRQLDYPDAATLVRLFTKYKNLPPSIIDFSGEGCFKMNLRASENKAATRQIYRLVIDAYRLLIDFGKNETAVFVCITQTGHCNGITIYTHYHFQHYTHTFIK